MSDQADFKAQPMDSNLTNGPDPYAEVRTYGAPVPGVRTIVAEDPDAIAANPLKPFIKPSKRAEAAPVEDGPFNLEIVVDTSYSMSGEKLSTVQQIVQELLKQKYMQGSNVGVVAYSGPHDINPKAHGEVKELPPVQITGMHGRDVTNFVDELSGNGMDPLTCSLDRAYERVHGKSRKAILYLGDGGNSCRKDPCDWALAHPDVPVYVVTPGRAQYFYDLTCLPQVTGGAYFEAKRTESKNNVNIIPMDIRGDGRSTQLIPHFNNDKIKEERANAGSLDFLDQMKKASGFGGEAKVYAELAPHQDHKNCNCHGHNSEVGK